MASRSITTTEPVCFDTAFSCRPTTSMVGMTESLLSSAATVSGEAATAMTIANRRAVNIDNSRIVCS
jgi:hypothetical protein